MATQPWGYDDHSLEFQVVGEEPCPYTQPSFENPSKYIRAELNLVEGWRDRNS